MLIGCPKEIKDHEDRVGLVPSSVLELAAAGHEIMIETNAGAGIGCSDEDYVAAGAKIVATADGNLREGRNGRQSERASCC